MGLDNKDFITLIRKDKNKAFNWLVEEYSAKVHNTCLYQVRSKQDAEDLTQEVFTAIYLSLDKFEGRSKISTWIYSISLNKTKEYIRKKTRKKRTGTITTIEREDSHVLPEGTINDYHPGKQLEDKERAEILMNAIEQLAENQKKAYLLNKYDGYSYTEVSEIMELSVSSVESLLFRAKKRLRELLSDYYKKNAH